MPRGIPNAKRDETGFRYTAFNVPLVANPKHMSTTYLKSESQTLWARNARNKGVDDATVPQESSRRGSQVIVIHPGSRSIIIGRASDVSPITVPNVVARKYTPPVPPPARIERISRPWRRAADDETELLEKDPFNEKIAAITVSLRDRMRFYKLRVTPNATTIASAFNEQFKPEIISEYNDPFRVEWTEKISSEDVYFGEKALRMADPHAAGYALRWPIYSANFNTRDYPSIQVILSDLELIIRTTLNERMDIESRDFKNYYVILVIPDFYDRAYVRELVNLLLITMGFKQLCAQQESLAATYGAGISNACVVNIGATTTNVACVDEGLVLGETRMSLSIGGDDITEFLHVLLQRINFPYRDIDLTQSYDWNVMEDLKRRLCTLTEADVALNLYDFVVRRPDRSTEKYGLRAYDEIILAPMVLLIRPKRGTSTPAEQVDPQAILTDDPNPPSAPSLSIDGIEIIDVEDESKAPTPSHQGVGPGLSNDNVNGSNAHGGTSQASPLHPGDFPIDVCFEASKLPLDVAIFNSARAAGGDEKIRKYLQAILVIGGTAHIPGMSHALESRLQAIATPLVPNMEKVQIIPPPKEVDPIVLAWKGAAVLGKMDGVSDLWVTQSDWDTLGMRALKERCFYL
ncbi:hypothetical protein DXG03_009399 [Asterophora parasitica]|uniref:Actin-related protein 8 n=1 Tax=Asterophora parasitica TaxID=117018 RepID=A0A9P7GCD2_9AGAR|nr:hypothetical protein DXG03_009399 [Asterophora parasitica]